MVDSTSAILFLSFSALLCSSNVDALGRKLSSESAPITQLRSYNTFEDLASIWNNLPLNLMKNASLSQKCEKAYKKFLGGVEENNLDSLKMLDATAKIPSGLLRGNVNQYGDYDECLEVPEAQYCLVEIDLAPVWSAPYSEHKSLIHSHFPIKEDFDNPAHRVPGFSLVRWGFCIPKECSSEDLENSLEQKLGVKAKIRPNMCQTKFRPKEDSFGRTFAIGFFSTICLLITTASLIDWFYLKAAISKNVIMRTLMGFSLKRNWRDMSTLSSNRGEIDAVHGVRGFSALALIMSHKVMSLFYNPYINRSVMTANLGMQWSVIGRTAILYTDCFMLISGLLSANALLSDLEKYKTMRFFNKLITRIFRISPNIIAVILFCTYILPNLGSGPQWPLVVNHHSELCKQFMWRNIFYVHNYFGFENMCLTHTHQVGIDMQLFIFTPIFVYLIYKNKRVGLWSLFTVGLVSTILRFWVTYDKNLSHVVHFGITISRMFDTANFSYILPTHRATIYLMGVYLAYLIRYTNATFTKLQHFLIWSFLVVISFAVWLGPVHMSVKEYEYNKIDAAFYGALSPIFWGAGIGWIIYTCNKDYGGFFKPMLNWKYFHYFTKIAYSVYLVQFPVFFYNVGKRRHVDEFSPFMMLQPVETAIIILISIALTLCIEMPFQNVRKVLFSPGLDYSKEKVTQATTRKFKNG